MATVDVLLPVRDASRFLGEAIDSIQHQTFVDWRLLILDHGSVDGSLQIAQKYEEEDARIKVFSFPNADGLGGLLNAGLEKCDCRFLLQQDADDIALPHRMELLTNVLADNPKLIAASGELIMINGAGREFGYLCRPIGPDAVTAAVFFYNPFIQGAGAINFPAFNAIGGKYCVDLLRALGESENIVVKQYAEDYFLFGQLALMGLCTNIDKPLIKYRVHATSTSISKVQEQLATSYLVSRFLTDSFCQMRNVPAFDPIPFSNHAGRIYNIDKTDLSNEFRHMSEILLKGLGQSSALRRELAFRWVLATRQPVRLLLRYAAFEMRYNRKGAERGIIRNWIRDGMPSRGW